MLCLLCPLLVIAFSATAHAGHADGTSPRERGRLILCEHLLSRSKVASKSATLVRDFAGLPYATYFVHAMLPAGLTKLGLDPEISPRELHNLILTADYTGHLYETMRATLSTVREGKLEPILRHEFPRQGLTQWETIDLLRQHEDLSYENLIREYTPHSNASELGTVGFHSEPDADGVRVFLSLYTSPEEEIDGVVTLGIDVPCDEIEKYTLDIVEVTDELRAPAGCFRRISVLTFAKFATN